MTLTIPVSSLKLREEPPKVALKVVARIRGIDQSSRLKLTTSFTVNP